MHHNPYSASLADGEYSEERVLFSALYDCYDIDLVLSGHTHGGVIRLPFVGGVYAPMQELFPYYDKGHFHLDEEMQMIVTAGLAGYEWVPRLFNPPEICTVTLIPKK